MSKLGFKLTKDKYLLILAAGICLMILAFPTKKIAVPASEKTARALEQASGGNGNGMAGISYEEQLERRVKSLLGTVEGVGKVDVMIVLKSSEEKVLRVDKTGSSSDTQESDSGGGTRSVSSWDSGESTVLTGSGDSAAPIVEKELKPEIEGIVISCEGGGNARIQAEISSAMEALFHVPQHKIRVLKRVD